MADPAVTELPDYERPPVAEIVAAVQFVPVAQFGIREAVGVSRAFEDWEVADVLSALEPMVEVPAGQLAGSTLTLGFGAPPVRLVLKTEGERWLAQVQQDRIAAHERKTGKRPSFANVVPKLHEVNTLTSRGLGQQLLAEPHRAEMVEVIYENPIPAGEGWEGFPDVSQVLRAFGGEVGASPYNTVEQAQLAFSYELSDGDQFLGRLRVIAEPRVEPERALSLHLRVISRRFVHNRRLDEVLDQCHADIVRGFTAVTTERMHEHWGRFQ